MLQFSAEPIDGGFEVVNSGFGNRCVLCGSYFDECGVCNGGHEKGKTYYLPPEPESTKTIAANTPAKIIVTCGVFNGCRCTICGGFFDDGDDICNLGRHHIGQQYAEYAK